MDLGTVHGIMTAILVVAFIGIVVWAWSGHKKQDFEEAARLAVDDEEAERQALRRQAMENQNNDGGRA